MKFPATRFSPARKLIFFSLLAFSAAGLAQQSTSVSLAGAAEVPPVSTSASGTARITVQADGSVSGSVTVSGMVPTMAHIHDGVAGKNGPVVVGLTKTSETTFTVPAGARFSEAQMASYMAGGYYVNVHSAEHPGGEMRGQLLPTATPPAASRSGY
jgi:hypothetical protein